MHFFYKNHTEIFSCSVVQKLNCGQVWIYIKYETKIELYYAHSFFIHVYSSFYRLNKMSGYENLLKIFIYILEGDFTFNCTWLSSAAYVYFTSLNIKNIKLAFHDKFGLTVIS